MSACAIEKTPKCPMIQTTRQTNQMTLYGLPAYLPVNDYSCLWIYHL